MKPRVPSPRLLAVLCLLAALVGCRSTALGGDRDYVVRFEGNQSVARRTLMRVIVDNLADFERFGRRASAIDDAAFTIESHYRSLGFPFVTTDWDVDRRADPLVVTLRVQEGPQTRLGRLTFTGNDAFSDSELAELVGGPTRLLGELTLFVRSEATAAVGAIESKYLSEGHLLVSVEGPDVTFRESRQVADVSYRIHEGPRFHIESIAFEGEEAVDEDDMRTALPVRVNEPYVPRVDRRIRAALIEFLGEEGHPDASVSVSRRLEREEGEVSLVVHVDEGPYVVVSSVRIEGAENTRESLVRSRLDVEIGEPFTPKRQRKTFRQLFTTGLFSRIRTDLEGEGTERVLVVRLTENPSREVFVEPGWGSYELGRLKAGYRNRNLFGTGRAFRAEGIAAFRHQELEIGVSDPFLFGADVFADVSAEVLRREEPSFTRISAGLDLSLTREWTTAFQTGVSYGFERSKARDVDVTDPDALAALDDVDISAIEVSARYDTRDSPLVPRSGHTARVSLQWGDRVLGSELDFLRARYSQSHFFPLREGTVLALSARAGAIAPTHDTDEIPIQERFFNGGEGTVRSFRQDELGPLDASGEPLGGEAFTVLSAEIRQRLVGNLSTAVFADTGNVLPDYADFLDFPDFRTALGFGIRYMLPIGPLRLDAAWNPDPEGNEDGFVLHFSVGMPF